MSTFGDIDKVRDRGETWAVDPEMREAFDQLGADLRGEIRSSAAETRAYVDDRIQTSAADLRGEIRSSAAETRTYIDERIETTRVYVDGRIQTSGAETRAYVDERIETSTASVLHEMRESESRTRRYFDVVGESLRGDIRGVAELVALSNEASKRRDDEQAGRTDGLEDRVVRLEVRVLRLEDNRKPRQPRRRR